MGILAIPTTLSASRLSAISGSGGPLPVRASDEDDRQGYSMFPGLKSIFLSAIPFSFLRQSRSPL